jgi:hypothetical protein
VDFLTTNEDGKPTRRAPNTLKSQRVTLRAFWRWAYRQGYVEHDPAANLNELELGSGQRRAGRWLTPGDALRLLDACLADGEEQEGRDMTHVLGSKVDERMG